MKYSSCTTAAALAVFAFAPFVRAEEKSPNQTITGTVSAKAVRVSDNAGNGVVTNAAKLTKTGGSALTLTGANTYVGTTTVSSGTTGSGTLTITGTASIESGPVTWLGLATDAVSKPLAAQLPIDKGTGLVISHVVPESPAQRAGLETNDVLIKFDDQLLINPDQLRALVQTKKAGDSVKLSYYRKGEQKEATVSLISKELTNAGDGTSSGVIHLQAGALKVDDLIKGLKSGGAPVTIEKKVMVIGPDGKVISLDSDSARGSVGEAVSKALEKAVEAVKKSGASEEVVKSVEKAVQDALKRSEDKPATEPKVN